MLAAAQALTGIRTQEMAEDDAAFLMTAIPHTTSAQRLLSMPA